MRFSAIHRATTYLTVLASHLALLLSGELHPVVAILVMLALPLSWKWEPPAVRLERYERFWRAATVAAFLAIAADVVLRETPFILGGVHFVLFLQTNKLFNRRSSKDYLQIYVVSFLELVAATGFNTDVTYAVCFGLYVVAMTWTLILFHLRREMEENYLLRHSDDAQSEKVEVERILNSRRIIGTSFLAATSVVSLVVFVGTTLVFFLFPRIGFGLFFQRNRPGVLMTGFDESIELGGFGTLRDNPTVVMRVEVPERSATTLRWRGIAFDRYDGKTWTKTVRRTAELSREADDIHWVPTRKVGDFGGLVVQDVYLEPLDGTNALFTLGSPAAFKVPASDAPGSRPVILRIDDAGDVTAPRGGSSFRYRAFTDAGRPTAAVLRAASPEVPAAVARTYLQLPPGAAKVKDCASPAGARDVACLAKRVAAGKTNAYDVAVAVEHWLRTDFAYSTELRRIDETIPPLEDFLFNRKAGHCEYFSTAMAVMLRTLGVPTRNVNGFLGGTWNSIGKYYSVRHGDAHSWVEVYFPGAGWVWFDPTPAAVLRAPDTGPLRSILEWVDAVRMQWFKYFIEYDLGKQIGAVKSLADWWDRVTGGSTAPGTDDRGVGSPVWALFLLGGLALAMLAFRWRRILATLRGRAPGVPRPATEPTRHAKRATQLYMRLVAALGRAGWRKDPRTTPREFAEELQRRGMSEADLVDRMTVRYNEARFGDVGIDDAEYEALRSQLRQLERDLRRGAHSSRRAGGTGTDASAPR